MAIVYTKSGKIDKRYIDKNSVTEMQALLAEAQKDMEEARRKAINAIKMGLKGNRP